MGNGNYYVYYVSIVYNDATILLCAHFIVQNSDYIFRYTAQFVIPSTLFPLNKNVSDVMLAGFNEMSIN